MIPDAGGGTYVFEPGYLEYRSPYWKLLDLNSIDPRHQIMSQVKTTTGLTTASWLSKINSPLIYQPNIHQRWWFFQDHPLASFGASVTHTLSAQAFQVSRYLSMRGAR
jgi:hypothetical protein